MFWISAILIFLIGNLPTVVFEQLPVILRFPRLILMCALFGFMFWMSEAKVNGKVFLFFILLLGAPALFQSTQVPDPSKRLLSSSMHNLIFDYGIKNGFIFYKYWYDGPETYTTDIAATDLKIEDVTIRENQIFYGGRQLTNSADNKLKASIIDNHSIIYLSDKGKGIGFYTLRTIPLNHEK